MLVDIIVYLFLVVLLLCVLVWVRAEVLHWRLKNTIVHANTGKPIGGPSVVQHYLELLATRNTVDIVRLEKNRNRYGPLFIGFRRHTPVIYISDASAAVKVLSDPEVYPKVSNLSGLVRNSVSCVAGNNWKSQRKVLTPAFKHISSFQDKIKEKATLCLSQWDSRDGVKVGHDLIRFTIDVLGVSIFGYEFGALEGKIATPLKAYQSIVGTVVNFWNVIFPFLQYFEKDNTEKYIEEFDKFIFSMVDNVADKEDQSGTSLLHYLFNAMLSKVVSKRELRDNIYLFFLAGHETTANALMFALYFLAQYPDKQEKIRSEVKGMDVTLDNLSQCNYLNNFINEVLRFYPPSDQISPRIITQTQEMSGYIVPKNTLGVVYIYGILHNKEIWGDDAEEFKPERWNNTKIESTKFIPFGSGPRQCLGRKFALVEQQILVCLLVQQYYLTLNSNSKMEFNTHSAEVGPDPEKLLINFKRVN